MQWIAALYVSYEGAGVILQAAGEEGEEVRCFAPSDLRLRQAPSTRLNRALLSTLASRIRRSNAIVVLCSGRER